MDKTYQSSQSIAQSEAGDISSREHFLVRTYNHLFMAILAFTLLEIALFKTGLAAVIASGLLSVNYRTRQFQNHRGGYDSRLAE